jgi:predicted small integral membrane protein
MNSRQIHIAISTVFALYMTLVVFNNITDYNANFSFLSGMVQMNELISPEKTRWRAITEPAIHHVLYLVIILLEFSIAAMLITGSIKMIRAYKGDNASFRSASNTTRTGLALGVIQFLGIFAAIGGEWFLMWQSEQFNGQSTAFFLTIIFLLGLLLFNQHDDK